MFTWKRKRSETDVADEKDHDRDRGSEQSTIFEKKNEDQDSQGVMSGLRLLCPWNWESSVTPNMANGKDHNGDTGSNQRKYSEEKNANEDKESSRNFWISSWFASRLWRYKGLSKSDINTEEFQDGDNSIEQSEHVEENIQTKDKDSKESHLAINVVGDTEVERIDVSEYPTGTRSFKLETFNKRAIAKVIITLCGNEGHDDSLEQKEIRKLLQGAITFFEKQPDDSLAKKWENADLIIFSSSETIVIRAGDGSYKFVVQMDGKDEVVCQEVNKNKCIIM